MAPAQSEVPYGTLDLMVLNTLAALGPLHGFGIARRIEQVAEGAIALNQGTIYPALLRLEQQSEGGIAADIDPLDRVHLHGDSQRHSAFLIWVNTY